jgi:adenine phosphoribosyltransferase
VKTEGNELNLIDKIRVIPDFPVKGVSFKDVTPVLQDRDLFKAAIDALKDKLAKRDFDVIVCPEARGFIFGSALAYAMDKGFVPVRKAGKLPYKTVTGEYKLEYGTDKLQIHQDAVKPGQRVVVLDDVLATGGTISAVINLVEELGGIVDSAAFLIELTYIPGRSALGNYEVISALPLNS